MDEGDIKCSVPVENINLVKNSLINDKLPLENMI